MPSSSYKNFSNNVFSSSPFVLDKSTFLRGLNSDYFLALYKKGVRHYGNQVCLFEHYTRDYVVCDMVILTFVYL